MPPLDPTKHILELLDLGGNNLVFIKQNYFSGFRNLKILDLSRNGLSVIPDITPLAGTLTRFVIRSNVVLSLTPALTDIKYRFLRRLDVSDNKLRELTPGMISQWPVLGYLDIECNFVQTLEDLSGMMREPLLMVCIEKATASPKPAQYLQSHNMPLRCH